MSLARASFTAVALALPAGPLLATSIVQPGLAVVQDFNTLPTTGTANTELPAGWYFHETGSGANTQFRAGNGSSTTGDTYSLGSTGSTDRALGMLRTGSVTTAIGTEVTNLTNATLADLLVAYRGEQWRLGSLVRHDRIDFAYSLDATSLDTGTWIDVDSLDFVAPITGGIPVGMIDGNLGSARELRTGSLLGVNLTPQSSLWLRWTDFTATNSNDALAIDDVMITGIASLVPATPDPVAVPEHMPLGATAALLAGLLGWGRRRQRRRCG